MKKYFISLIIFMISSTFFSQDSEVDFQLRYGFATNNLKEKSGFAKDGKYHQQILSIYPQYDFGGSLLYKFKIWKKQKLFLNVGGQLDIMKDYQPIYDNYSSYLLGGIDLKNNRIGLDLGISKQLEFYDGKMVLDLGVNVIKRFAFNKTKHYERDMAPTPGRDWISYSYDMSIYSGKYYDNSNNIKKINANFNLAYNATLKFKTSPNTYVNFGCSYIRNNVYFYDLKYTTENFINGSTIPEVYNYQSHSGSIKEGVKNNYFYLTAGISIKFNSFIKNETKEN
ncbi:MAG: hypothetical protein HYR91_04555 [Flavobacteriia bacterium]|nr:hypothetical protein [Flavobacteriia bacterium]